MNDWRLFERTGWVVNLANIGFKSRSHLWFVGGRSSKWEKF